MNRPHVPLSVYFKPNQYYNDFIQNSNKNYVSYVNETNEIERCFTPAHNLNIDFLTSKIGQEYLFRNKIPYQFFEKNNGFQSTKNKYPYYYQRDFNDYERVINKIYSHQTSIPISLSKSMDFTKLDEDSKYDKYLNENNFDKEDYKSIPKDKPIEIQKEEIKIPENKDIYEEYKKRYIKPPTPKANSNEESKHIYYDENKIYDYENKNNDLKEEAPIQTKEYENNLDYNYNRYNTKSTSNILKRSSEEILNNNNPYVRTPRNDKEFFDKYPEYNDDNYLRGIAINREKQKLFTKDSPIREKLIRRKMLTENPYSLKPYSLGACHLDNNPILCPVNSYHFNMKRLEQRPMD